MKSHPIAELLECPPETGAVLNAAIQCLQIASGDTVFRQHDPNIGLYIVVAGEFLRRCERLTTRVTLGPVHAGEIVELAAVLSGSTHTYTLTALSDSTLLMLPVDALNRAFDQHPPLRMNLLEELAREVSRAYISSNLSRIVPVRRQRGDQEGRSLTS